MAYRRLLDQYYLHERTLSEDVTSVARLIDMKDNAPEVRVVLEEFFTLVPGKGWINVRADEEILKVPGQSAAGKKGS